MNPLQQREMPSQPDVSEPTISAPNVLAPTPEVADTAPPFFETDVPSVAVVPSEPVAQREMPSQPDVSEPTISAPSSTVPTPELVDTVPPSVEFGVPPIGVAPSEPVAQREMPSQPDVSEPTVSAPNVPPPTSELVETVRPSVEFAVPPISVAPSEPIAQREMPSQSDVPETTISLPSSPVPTPEIADTAQPSVEFAVPPISSAQTEAVAQREMPSQPDVSEPNVVAPTADVTEIASTIGRNRCAVGECCAE